MTFLIVSVLCVFVRRYFFAKIRFFFFVDTIINKRVRSIGTYKHYYTMKKIVILSIIMMLAYVPAQAQLGGLLQKAANRTAKVLEKKVDSVANAAIEQQMSKQRQSNQATAKQEVAAEEELTYDAIMRKMPELPTAQQLCSHKEAELNEQALRLLTSAVTRFNTQVLSLATQAVSISTKNMDSAQVVDAAYKYAQLSTGMTKEELEHLASLPEDEQEAYIAAHYRVGTAETAMAQEAVDAGKYLEPLQPLIDKWDAVGRKADQVLEQADAKCKHVYQKYAPMLEKASGKERNKLMLNYYKDIVEYQRTAVQEVLKIRLEEQLPIAEEIEAKMVKIRAEHQDLVSALLNYPQLTASQYFAEVSRLVDVPVYSE